MDTCSDNGIRCHCLYTTRNSYYHPYDWRLWIVNVHDPKVAGGKWKNLVRDTKAHLSKGGHTLTICALDDHIVVDQITIL
jgi:hypothetical protein